MLTIEDIMTLRQNGFTEAECLRLNQDLESRPQFVDLESPDWQAVLEKRKAYMDYKTEEVARRNKCSLTEAYRAIQKYINTAYEKISGLSPWVFFRAEYQRAVSRKKDYMKALKAREKAQGLAKQVYKP